MQRSVISLVAGIGLAVVAVLLLTIYVRSERSDAEAVGQAQFGDVVVATSDFAFGTPIHREYLKVVPWPKASVPQTSFASVDEVYAGVKTDSDRIALKNISADEPILRSSISGFGGRATMSRQVSAGMRAYSIPVNDVSGVAGFMLPGDRVDIMLTRQVGEGENRVTDVILQNVTVLGVDQEADQARDKPEVARTATVEVTPEQAQKLALAQQVGTLSLSLRGTTSAEQVATTRINTGDLTNAEPTAVPSNNGPTVRIHYGSGNTVEKVVPQ